MTTVPTPTSQVRYSLRPPPPVTSSPESDPGGKPISVSSSVSRSISNPSSSSVPDPIYQAQTMQQQYIHRTVSGNSSITSIPSEYDSCVYSASSGESNGLHNPMLTMQTAKNSARVTFQEQPPVPTMTPTMSYNYTDNTIPPPAPPPAPLAPEPQIQSESSGFQVRLQQPLAPQLNVSYAKTTSAKKISTSQFQVRNLVMFSFNAFLFFKKLFIWK